MADAPLERGVRLLRFLAAARRSIDSADTDLAARTVLRFDEIPDHPAVRVTFPPEGSAPELLSVAPVTRPSRPVVPPELMPWISGDIDRPSARLRLRARATTTARWNTDEAEAVPVVERLSDRPDVRASWDDWHPRWQQWSRTERTDAPAADLHARLSALIDQTDPGEEFVLGLGMPDRPAIDRHLFTVRVQVRRDGAGNATIRLDPHACLTLSSENVGDLTEPEVGRLAAAARRLARPILDETALNDLISAHMPDDETHRAPRLRLSPALLVRRRDGIPASALEGMADDIERDGRAPAGLRVLFGRSEAPPAIAGAGALVPLDDDALCPFPVTPAQRTVVEAAGAHAQTLVQAAPGPQRSRTIAALVTQFLAQGCRVLVTGTDEGVLSAVHADLPSTARALTLATTGPDTAGATIDTLTRRFLEPEQVSHERLESATERLRDLADRRRQLVQEALRSRDDEARTWTVRDRTGTLGDLARRQADDRDLDRLLDHVTPPVDAPAPLTTDEARTLRDLLRDPEVRLLAPRFHGHHPDPSGVPDPEEFARLVGDYDAASRRTGRVPAVTGDGRFGTLAAADESTRKRLRRSVDEIRRTVLDAEQAGAWATTAVRDIVGGDPTPWFGLARTLDGHLTEAVQAVEDIGAEVTVLADVPDLTTRVEYLREHLVLTGPLVVGESGIPRLGVQVPDPVRIGHTLFMNLRVDGSPPSSVEHLDAVLRYVAAQESLDDLDDAWPDGTVIPLETAPRTRLAWHADLVRHLLHLLDLTDVLAVADGTLEDLGLPSPAWADPAALDTLLRLLDAVDDEVSTAAAARPLSDLALRLAMAADHDDAPESQRDLRDAARAFDVDGYERAWTELCRGGERAEALAEVTRLTDALRQGAPRLLAALEADPDDPAWELMDRFEEAWGHCARAGRLTDLIECDPNVIASEIIRTEDLLTVEAESLAGLRAWAAAVVPDRLPAQTRVDLALCSHLTRRLDDGRGSDRQRAELDRVRARCRPAIPAWIVPVHRLTEQFALAPDLFDVVIVADASDLGGEATLLRALAPRTVLFGDRADLPEHHPGPDAEQLTELADSLLHDDPHRSAWLRPRRSMFGDARIRGGARITLDTPPGAEPDVEITPPQPTSAFVAEVTEAVVGHGYTVSDAPGRGVDLLVAGHRGRLAVSCERGAADDYAQDLAAQRNLERAGVPVHRIRESAFVLDRWRELAALWRALDRAHVRPVRPTSPGVVGPTTARVELGPYDDASTGTDGATDAYVPDGEPVMIPAETAGAPARQEPAPAPSPAGRRPGLLTRRR